MVFLIACGGDSGMELASDAEIKGQGGLVIFSLCVSDFCILSVWGFQVSLWFVGGGGGLLARVMRRTGDGVLGQTIWRRGESESEKYM